MSNTYRLTKTADQAITSIYIHGFDTFGESLAESYHEGLHHTFDIIARHPFIGKVADEFLLGLRQFRYQSHSIFYSLHDDHILVEHVLHKKADVRKHFIDS